MITNPRSNHFLKPVGIFQHQIGKNDVFPVTTDAVIGQLVGIEINSEMLKGKVYPNPFKDEFTIELEGAEKSDATTKSWAPLTPVLTPLNKEGTKVFVEKALQSSVQGGGTQVIKREVSISIGEKILGYIQPNANGKNTVKIIGIWMEII